MQHLRKLNKSAEYSPQWAKDMGKYVSPFSNDCESGIYEAYMDAWDSLHTPIDQKIGYNVQPEIRSKL